MSLQHVMRLIAAATMAVLGLAGASSARAADAPGCKDPGWGATRFPAYAIINCAETVWTQQNVPVGKGTKTLAGHSSVVEYQLGDQTKGTSTAAQRARYIQLAQKAGAKLMSDPAQPGAVALSLKNAQGEFWYIYEPLGGNDQTMTTYRLTTFRVEPLNQEIRAQAMGAPLDVSGSVCKDPPWMVKQYSYFKRDSCEVKAWDTIEFDLPAGSKTIEGKRLTVNYDLTDEKKAPTALVAQKNAVLALQSIGAKLVSDPNNVDRAILTQRTPVGEFWYVYVHGNGNSDYTGSYTVTTWQLVPFNQEVQAQPVKAALDTSGGPCKDPAWLVKQFSYFKLDGCEAKTWDSVQIGLPGGQKTLEGKRITVTYALTDEKKAPTALAAKKNYVQALQSAGAKLMSDPNNEDTAVLTETTPQGEFWIIYEHGNGNSGYTGSYSVTTWQLEPFPQEVQAQPMPGGLSSPGNACPNPPWVVKQFAAFKISTCSYRDFDSVDIDLPAGKKTLAGRILVTDYVPVSNTLTPTQPFAGRNYRTAMKSLGGTEASDPAGYSRVVFTQKTPRGEFWEMYSVSGGNDQSVAAYELTTVQIGGPPPKTCKLEIYGVNFDFNKATLRPESEPVLTQVLSLFTADSSYAGEIGGHTDNIGSEPYNLKLSGQRAAAVKAWLVVHGVAATRLTTQGYGDTKPLVPNTTDENRFKNRRVELKKNNCK
ncbi:MAG: OmpA family protein [Rhizomicrobium sp.]|jgi:outer membrane protein OmpA-like peptidoglycan-associated protein